MKSGSDENVFGALILGLSDALISEVYKVAPEPGQAASLITLLRHEPGMTIEKLRRIFGLSHPGTVRLVDRMIKENLVEKRSSTVDRRAVALFLSDKGEKLCNEILNARQVRLAETLALLEQDERKTYINLTKKLLLGTIKNENHANSIPVIIEDA